MYICLGYKYFCINSEIFCMGDYIKVMYFCKLEKMILSICQQIKSILIYLQDVEDYL